MKLIEKGYNSQKRFCLFVGMLVAGFTVVVVGACPYLRPATTLASICSHCDPADPYMAPNGTGCVIYTAANNVLCDCGSTHCDPVPGTATSFFIRQYNGWCSQGSCTAYPNQVAGFWMELNWKNPAPCSG